MNDFKHIENLKKEYESIYASDELKKRVNKIIKKKRFSFPKKMLSAAAVFLVVLATSLNIFPNFARAASDVPFFGAFVKVITLGRYENSNGGYEAKVITPKIEGLVDKELEQKLNSDFKENADLIISAYEKDVAELKKEFGEETIHMGVTFDYCIKTDTNNVLSLDVYLLYTAGSSSTKHSFYTIDKKSGKLLALKDLFKKDTDYISPISKYIKQEMKRLNAEEDGLFWTDEEEIPFEGFKAIKKDQNFYINEKNELVICFDKYEIAAGAQGSPEFVIPKNITNKISAPSSIIGK